MPFTSLITREHHQYVLFIPVLLALGIAVYFMLPEEPPILTAGVVLLPLPLLYLVRKHDALRILLIACVCVALGYSAALYRAHRVNTPVLAKDITAIVEGTVLSMEPLKHGNRMIMEVSSFTPKYEGRTVERIPQRVRIAAMTKLEGVEAGDVIRIEAVLRPPPKAALPGGYDFAKRSYFEGIGAVGFSISDATLITQDNRLLLKAKKDLVIQAVRERITQGFLHGLPRPEADIATALMVGNKAGIPEEVMESIRQSGLAHLLAISGLHLVLVCGIFYVLFRYGFACFPRLVLYYPIKKWAAVAALLGGGVYLLLAGQPVSAQRAYIMAAVFFGAIILDRSPTSMRSIALAGTIILLFLPESLFTPSFQMSFAAATALIAAYDAPKLRFFSHGVPGSYRAKFLRYVGGVALSSLVAGSATTPFVIYHFHRYAMGGMMANLISVPLTSFIIMPLGLLSILLMPLGLSGLTLPMMGYAIDVMLWVARSVEALPFNLLYVPAIHGYAIGVLAFGMVNLCIWKTRLRLVALPFIAGGIIMAVVMRDGTPDMIIQVDKEGTLIAAKNEYDHLVFVEGKPSAYIEQSWLAHFGQDNEEEPEGDEESNGYFHCDAQGCIYRSPLGSIGISDDAATVIDDCDRVSLMIYTGYVPVYRSLGFKAHCQYEKLLKRYQLYKEGTHVLRFDGAGGVTMVSTSPRYGGRLWER